MSRRTRYITAGFVLLVLLGAGVVIADRYFLPEKATRVNEELEGMGEGEVERLKSGNFQGKAGHRVSGTASLVRVGADHYLRFEGYEQTQGPDVFVYLTPSTDPDSYDEIQAGVKIPIDGGADGGESTKVGTFSQRLPPDLSLDTIQGVAIWCDRFRVPFGAAPLAPAEPG